MEAIELIETFTGKEQRLFGWGLGLEHPKAQSVLLLNDEVLVLKDGNKRQVYVIERWLNQTTVICRPLCSFPAGGFSQQALLEVFHSSYKKGLVRQPHTEGQA